MGPEKFVTQAGIRTAVAVGWMGTGVGVSVGIGAGTQSMVGFAVGASVGGTSGGSVTNLQAELNNTEATKRIDNFASRIFLVQRKFRFSGEVMSLWRGL